MPIKFTCPHCKRAMVVNDNLAGKKGRCKACQQILTVPSPANAKPSAPAASPAAPPAAAAAPPPLPADVEAEAAALFADEPKTEEPAEVKTIDLNCPFCDEPIHFPADLAGKRAPCPECSKIIKVPDLVKKDPKDWRKADPRGPSGARLPDQPALEGAWGSVEAGRVGRKTLEEVGVIPTEKPPRTTWQKIRWPLAGAGTLIVLVGIGLGGYAWWSARAVGRLLNESMAYAAGQESAKQVGEPGQAELFLGGGEYQLRAGSAEEAKKQLGKAFTRLQSARPSPERDAALTDLALAQVELGGSDADAKKGWRLRWEEIQKLLTATLSQVLEPEARRQAVRAVVHRLIEHGETQRAVSLVNLVYSAPNDEKAVALCVLARELLQAKDQEKAESVITSALGIYDTPKPPPLRAEVIALGKLLKNKALELPKDADDKQKAVERIAQVEILAQQEKWEQARKDAEAIEGEGKFRALLALAVVAVENKFADAAGFIDAAAGAAEKVDNKAELSWMLLRLTEMALTAGMPEERVQAVADGVPDRAVRGRAQLAMLRARLASSSQPVEASAADKIDSRSVASALAAEELARHNTRLDKSWAKNVQGWEQPRKAFGSLGAALGLQDRAKK